MARHIPMVPEDIKIKKKGPVIPRETGNTQSTNRPPRHVTPSAQRSQGLPSGPVIPPVKPKEPKNPLDVPMMSRHSSFFHLSNYRG
jgi:hypothetical protein